MRRTFACLSAGLIALGAQVASAQETTAPVAQAVPGPPSVERRVERRELRRSGELGPARAAAANANAANANPAGGTNIAVPGAGVGISEAPGAGVGIAAPGVGVAAGPAGSGAGVQVNVPGAGVNATINPNAWRYRWNNNRWWYYHPNNRWSFWNNNRWNAYNPPSTAAAGNYATRRYSNAPRYQSGYRGMPNGTTGTAADVQAPGVNVHSNPAPANPARAAGPAQGNLDKSPLERANRGDASGPPSP